MRSCEHYTFTLSGYRKVPFAGDQPQQLCAHFLSLPWVHT